MSTLTKKLAARKPAVRRPTAGKLALEEEIRAAAGTRTPPPAKFTTADVLRSLRDGSFDQAAAKCDWDLVETTVKNRRSSVALRAARA